MEDRYAGWRKRKRSVGPALPTTCALADYTIENPANGKLWALPAVRDCSARAATTSYCKYGTSYSKPTTIAHTFGAQLMLRPPCSKRSPCPARRDLGKHANDLTAITQKAARNSLPSDLVRSLLGACEQNARKHDACAILFVDVFSGWGSVSTVVEETATLPTFVYTNDISRARNCHLDADIERFGLMYALKMAMLKMHEWMDSHPSSAIRCASDALAKEGADLAEQLRLARVHLWLHLSVPCTTYSTMGGGTHRDGGSIAPKTILAATHDRMVAEMVPLLDTIVTQCRVQL